MRKRRLLAACRDREQPSAAHVAPRPGSLLICKGQITPTCDSLPRCGVLEERAGPSGPSVQVAYYTEMKVFRFYSTNHAPTDTHAHTRAHAPTHTYGDHQKHTQTSKTKQTNEQRSKQASKQASNQTSSIK